MSNETIYDQINQQNMSVRDFVLLALGFGCLIAYSRMASLGFDGYLSGGVIETTDQWYVVRCIAGLVTLLLLAVLAGTGKTRFGTWTIVITTIASMAAAAITAFGGLAQFGWVVALLGGCSVSMFMYIWLLLLSHRSLFDIVMTVIAGGVIASALIMGVPRVQADIGASVAIAAALVTGLATALLDRNLETSASDGPLNRENAHDVPWFTLIAFVICGFVATVVFGVAQQLAWLYDWSPNYIAFGVAALAVIAATFAIMFKVKSWKDVVWIPQVLLLAVALALSCFSIRESLQTSVGFLLASVFCAHFLHWAVFAAILSQHSGPKAVLASILLFVSNYSIATIAGNALGSSLPHSMQNLGGVAGIATITLAALLSATYLVIWLMRASEAIAAPIVSLADVDANLQARLSNMAHEHELTPREAEVALLTAQGFSGAYIAQKLVVSNSTVRFHQQNLYRKMGVHSRDDFIELTHVD